MVSRLLEARRSLFALLIKSVVPNNVPNTVEGTNNVNNERLPVSLLAVTFSPKPHRELY